MSYISSISEGVMVGSTAAFKGANQAELARRNVQASQDFNDVAFYALIECHTPHLTND